MSAATNNRADRTAAHSQLVAAIRLRLGRESGLTLYLNTKGRLKRVGGASIYVTDPALGVGTSDLVAMLRVEHAGRHFALWFCLEVKTGDAVLTREQKLFRDLVIAMGGFFGEVRSVDDAATCLALARAGSSAFP